MLYQKFTFGEILAGCVHPELMFDSGEIWISAFGKDLSLCVEQSADDDQDSACVITMSVNIAGLDTGISE